MTYGAPSGLYKVCYAMIGSIPHAITFDMYHVVCKGILHDHVVCFGILVFCFDHVVCYFKAMKIFNLDYLRSEIIKAMA